MVAKFGRTTSSSAPRPQPAELPSVNMLVWLQPLGEQADGEWDQQPPQPVEDPGAPDPDVDPARYLARDPDPDRGQDPDPARDLGNQLEELGGFGPGRLELPSRVEDVEPAGFGWPARFQVSAPCRPGDLLASEPGIDWRLSWVSERGRWELDVRREVGTRSTASVPGGPVVQSWWLVQNGPPRRDQRRRFYRVNCSLPIEVDVLSEPFTTLSGRTMDLSEGGLRCLLPTEDLDVGTRTVVRLGLESAACVLPSVVRRTRRLTPNARVAGWYREVALAFDDPEPHGDVLRRAVARLQLRSRKLAGPNDR